MSKREEFEHQLSQLNIKITEKIELREDLIRRIREEEFKELDMNKEKTLTLNEEGLRKLLCYLETTIVDDEVAPSKSKGWEMLHDFRDELAWEIADILEIDLNEGSIDTDTLEYYEYGSKRWSND